jgi:hypothetical protein
MEKVEVSRGALAGLLLALLASLMAVAFLLGRQSVQPVPAPPSAVAVTAVTPVLPELIEQEPVPSQRLLAAAPPRPRSGQVQPARSEVAEVPAAQGQTEPAAVSVSAGYPRARLASEREKLAAAQPVQKQAAPAVKARKAPDEGVRKYLNRIDAVLAGTPSLSDHSAFATQLLQQSMVGDTTGLDQLIQASDSALSKIREITPPPACKEHHQLMLSQLKTGAGLLRQVKKATMSMDTSGLAALSLQGQGMQTDTLRLQQLDRELRASIAGSP